MQAAIFLALSVGIIKTRRFLIETKPAAEEHAVGVGGFAGVVGADAGTDYHADNYYDNLDNDYHGTHY